LRHATFAEARAAAAGVGATAAQRPYRCDKCRAWHLTSRRKA